LGARGPGFGDPFRDVPTQSNEFIAAGRILLSSRSAGPQGGDDRQRADPSHDDLTELSPLPEASLAGQSGKTKA
jgi:hypothetical protein